MPSILRSSVLLCATALLSFGCFPRAEIPTRYAPRAEARSFAPVGAEQVQRYWGLDWEKLPEGVTLVGRPEAPTGVATEKAFPTAQDPTEVLGVLTIATDAIPGDEHAAQHYYAEQAGTHGGNAYVELPRSGTAHLVVLHVSEAKPEFAFPPPATLLSKPVPELSDYHPSGDTQSKSLDTFSPVVIDAKRGNCYGVRAALDTSAYLNRLARRFLGLRATGKGARVDSKSPTPRRGALLSAREAWLVVGCPTNDGPIAISYDVGFDSKNPNAGANVGTGDVVFQIYEKNIAAEDLDHKATRDAADWDAQQRAQRTHFTNQQCLSCVGQLASCQSGTAPASCAPFTTCLFQKGMKVDDCQ